MRLGWGIGVGRGIGFRSRRVALEGQGRCRRGGVILEEKREKKRERRALYDYGGGRLDCRT